MLKRTSIWIITGLTLVAAALSTLAFPRLAEACGSCSATQTTRPGTTGCASQTWGLTATASPGGEFYDGGAGVELAACYYNYTDCTGTVHVVDTQCSRSGVFADRHDLLS